MSFRTLAKTTRVYLEHPLIPEVPFAAGLSRPIVVPCDDLSFPPLIDLRAGLSIAHKRLRTLQLLGSRRHLLVLTIRLSRIGKKKKPFYRVVVIERTRPRNGRVVDAVGTYDPLKKPAEIKLDAERVKHWLGRGAQPSDTVRSFLRRQKIA
jgi:small subunit ribosomal protein S16